MIGSQVSGTVLGEDSVDVALCELRAVSTVQDLELDELWVGRTVQNRLNKKLLDI